MNMIKKSIFRQNVHEINYYFEKYSNKGIGSSVGKKLESTEVLTCEIPMPLLKVGDSFYIEESDLIIKVEQVIRTSKDNVLYVTGNKYIDTEQSLKQKDYIEKLYKDYLCSKEELSELEILKSYSDKSGIYKLFVTYTSFKSKLKIK